MTSHLLINRYLFLFAFVSSGLFAQEACSVTPAENAPIKICKQMKRSQTVPTTKEQLTNIHAMENIFACIGEDKKIKCSEVQVIQETFNQIKINKANSPFDGCAEFYRNHIHGLYQRAEEDKETNPTGCEFKVELWDDDGPPPAGYDKVCKQKNREGKDSTPTQRMNIARMENVLELASVNDGISCDEIASISKQFTDIRDDKSNDQSPFDGCAPEYKEKITSLYKEHSCTNTITLPISTLTSP
jgi:hypothetical protein